MLPPLLYTWKFFCTNAISYVSFSGTQKLTIDAIIQGGYSADNMWEYMIGIGRIFRVQKWNKHA
jgi:hypothetical protein